MVVDASSFAPDAASPAPDAGVPFRVSLSISPFDEVLFANSLSFTDGVRVATDMAGLEDLLMAHGGTEVYARFGTPKTKPAGAGGIDSSLARGLDRARIAQARNLPFNPELGLFRIYSDVSCQSQPDFTDWGITLPGAWETLTVDQMVPALQQYTALAATEILKTGVRVDVWDLGNEVDFGTAGVAPKPIPGACDGDEGAGWYHAPDGVDPQIGLQSVVGLLTMAEADRITWLQAHVWSSEAKLLAAAAAGVRSVAPNARFATHISMSVSPTFALAFYQAMRQGGFAVDVAGFSCYPSASDKPTDRLHQLRLTVEAVHSQLGLPVFLAEYSYPAQPMATGPYASWNNAIANYPISEAGQHDLLVDLASWGASGALSGIRPWAPEVFVGDWAPMTLFKPLSTTRAQPRTGLDAITQGLAAPNPNALKD